MDWRDPDFRTERNAAFVARMQGEIRELLSNYGPIDVLWFDWDGGKPMYDQPSTYSLVKKLQPKIILTNRLDLGEGSNDRQILSPCADYYTPEQSVGGYDDQRPWESCMTISQRGQWAWGGPSDGVKTFAECMHMLVRCAGGDGNMLLNVGPMPTGEIAPEQAGRLKEMGVWLAKYGESIYGTRGGPFKPGRFGVSTRKGRTVYLHIQHWPGETLSLPAIPAKVVRCVALAGGAVAVRQTADVLDVTLPARDRQELDTIVALELDRPAAHWRPSPRLPPRYRWRPVRRPRPPTYSPTWPNTAREKPSTATARPAGPPMPARSRPGWRWISAGRLPSADASSNRHIRSCSGYGNSPSRFGTTGSGSPVTAVKTSAQRSKPRSRRSPPSECD